MKYKLYVIERKYIETSTPELVVCSSALETVLESVKEAGNYGVKLVFVDEERENDDF